jgi:Holliday junction resolvase RusA-like endonuclease
MGKPRMTQRDRWKKRDVVVRYYTYKDTLNILAKKDRYIIQECLSVEFYLPIPKSWSKKKKKALLGHPHQQTPDIDNLAKAFMDCLCKEDSHIYRLQVSKFWAEQGKIIIRL